MIVGHFFASLLIFADSYLTNIYNHSDSVSKTTYNFSFTSSSLRLNEMILVARQEHFTDNEELALLLGSGKRSTGKKILTECKLRLSTLTKQQKELLLTGDIQTQKQMAFLAVCKRFLFIRDFVFEVIREKFLLFDHMLTDGDFVTFLRRKSELHPEIENLTDLTLKKIKQVTFKILEQSGLIDSVAKKNILPQFLERSAVQVIYEDNHVWLKLFLYADAEIKKNQN